MRCMIPQPFASGGKWSYSEFWAVIGDPQYPGYYTLTVAPSPPLSGWPEPVTRQWAEHVLICYYGHSRGIRRPDHGAKASMVSTENHMVVPTSCSPQGYI
jgi:hypothetical protein